MSKKNNLIKELGKHVPKKEREQRLFGWTKNVAPVAKPESGNMHKRSTMQTKAPSGKSNTVAEHASVRAKRR